MKSIPTGVGDTSSGTASKRKGRVGEREQGKPRKIVKKRLKIKIQSKIPPRGKTSIPALQA